MSEREHLLSQRYEARALACQDADDPDACLRDALEEVLGEMAIEERDWMPLCPEYPNLKGATCGEVEAVLPGSGCETDPEVSKGMCGMVKRMLEYGNEWHMLKNFWHCATKEPDANYRVHANYLDPADCYERARLSDADCKCEPMGKGFRDNQFLKCRSPCDDLNPIDLYDLELLMDRARAAGADQTDYEWKTSGADLGAPEEPDKKAMLQLERFVLREALGYKQEAPLRGRKEHQEYIKATRCFSRDEMFVAFKDLGDRIRYQMNPVLRDWDRKTPEERRKLLDESIRDVGPYEDIFGKLENLASSDVCNLSLSEIAPKDRDLMMTVGRLHPLATERWDIYSDGDPLKDGEGSVFITTPRGGLEMLGIFAYANGMPKHKFPGDFYTADVEDQIRQLASQEGAAFYRMQTLHNEIKDLERKPIKDLDADLLYGLREKHHNAIREYDAIKEQVDALEAKINTTTRTWLNDVAHNVRRIFVVDDIVASGEQQSTLMSALKHILPKDGFVVYPVILCARTPLESQSNHNQANYSVQLSRMGSRHWHNAFDDSFTYQRTQGIRTWHQAYEEWAEAVSIEGDTEHTRLLRRQLDDRAPTCVFPHSIADGKSDTLLIRVYGDRVWKGKLRVMRERKDT